MPLHTVTATGVRYIVDATGRVYPVRASDNTAVFMGETHEAIRAGLHLLGTAGTLAKPATHQQ